MHDEAIRKADVLIGALGYIRKFHGKFVVIKLGGSVMEDPETLRALLVDVVFMQTVGMRPVVVHGGGKAIDLAMKQAGMTPRWVKGRRYTDDATLEIVARVLAEEINADIERHINKFGGRASGLHHKTHQCLFGRKLMLPGEDGVLVDLGRVGEVTEVDIDPLENLCLAGVVPVLPSLAEDEAEEGRLLNVNADTAAAAVAQAIRGRETRIPDRYGWHSQGQERTRKLDLGSDTQRLSRSHRAGRDRSRHDPQGRGLPDLPRRRGS